MDNYEHRSYRAAVPVISPVLLGLMARALGGLNRAFIAADCLFPPLLFLLFFALADVSVFSLRLLVAWASLIVSFGLLNSIWLGTDALTAPLEIARTPQPEISFPILLVAIALLARAVSSNWKWAIGSGIASAAIVYSYYFYAVAWSIALVSALLFGLLWRKPDIWTRSLLTFGVMIALAAPYLLLFHTNALLGQHALLARMGEFTHQPSIAALVVGVVSSFLLWRFARPLRPVYLFLLLTVFGAVCGMNLQIVTGYETQSWHFWKRLALPILFFLLSILVVRRFSRAALLGRVLLFILLCETAARLTVAGVRSAPLQRASSPRNQLLLWVRQHLPQNQVIGTVDSELILLIPALTTEYTYVPSGLRSLTATPEIEQRYFEIACLVGFTPGQVAAAIAAPDHSGRASELLHTLGVAITQSSDAERAFLAQYRSAYESCAALHFRLDFVVVSSEAETRAVRERFPAARELYRNANYRLLGVR